MKKCFANIFSNLKPLVGALSLLFLSCFAVYAAVKTKQSSINSEIKMNMKNVAKLEKELFYKSKHCAESGDCLNTPTIGRLFLDLELEVSSLNVSVIDDYPEISEAVEAHRKSLYRAELDYYKDMTTESEAYKQDIKDVVSSSEEVRRQLILTLTK
jgi:hypothetical protein